MASDNVTQMMSLSSARYHRDLEWMLNSPELLALTPDVSTNELVDRMSVKGQFGYQQTHRLGVYFEQLWQHLANHCDSLSVVEHNLQVIIDKHTYGEFDSILCDRVLNRILHCELAVKFYLQVGTGQQLYDWVGPNLQDRFDSKFERLFEHQLTLSDSDKIKRWLSEKDIQIDQTKVLTRGRLFYPLEHFMEDDFTFPAQVNARHLKGFWTSWQNFAHVQSSSDIEWYLLPKMYWLSELTADDMEQLQPLDDRAFLIHSHNEKYPFQRIQQLVGMRKGNEVMRGFVVTPEWLEKAKARVQKPS